jgi:hypothetical protein
MIQMVTAFLMASKVFFGTDPSVPSAGIVIEVNDSSCVCITHPENSSMVNDITATYIWSKDLVNFYPSVDRHHQRKILHPG